MARLLVIGPEEKAELKRIKDYAEAHEYTIGDIAQIHNGLNIPGDNPNYVCQIPIDYKVVFTIDHTLQEEVKVRHVSISLPAGKMPGPYELDMVLQELGFKNKVVNGPNDNFTVYPEPISETHVAINVIEKI